MKKWVSCLLSLALVLSGAVALAEGFAAGTYTGTAQGFGGDVTATVTLSETEITDIQVVGDQETDGLGSVAIEQLPPKMLEVQSPNVDAMSGATVTSNAIIEAVTAALSQAGVDASALVPKEAEDKALEEQTLEADVVVIGAGGAGMTAAITAHEAGKEVILLEKMPYAGGNTTKSTGGMNAAETSVQAELGIEDSVQTFIDDTMTGGKNVNDLALVTTMAENSAEAIDWLASIGAPLPEVSFSGGATNKRIHRPEGGAAVGPYLVEKLLAKIGEDEISLLYNTEATELIVEDGAVTGVKATGDGISYTINAKAVVLATGGFGANLEMCAEYNPDLAGFVTTNSPCATGDGIKMAEAAGAATVDMEQIQIHPTVYQATSLMVTESVRGGGAILVNASGERFIDEMETRDVVSAAEIAQEGGYAYLVFDQAQRDNLSAIDSYVSNGLTVQADTIEDLATQMGVDAANLQATVEAWNKAVAEQNDEAFGRTTGMDVDISVAPFYAIQIAPGIHHTMGGVKIDTTASVIGVDGEPIPGLFAAGEVTGGVHGANRIGGNAVADIIVFGRIAGQSAADYAGK
ncbi:MAG TPA: flavocytochrome c [Candidatus Ventricola gallistercoris]|nr:flavocytochrome c [Candidatus Ventricola gallistercoris]